jgi:P27 family predicted phage terminase small subunit
MGRRGPAPKPTQLRLLHGDRPARINDREPVARDVLPDPPEGMADDVREVWRYTLRELAAMRIASAADRDSLTCYCEAVITHRKASAILARTPVLVKGALGTMVRNPALAIQRDAAQTIRAYAQEFGLTPSGRSRIVTEGRASAEPTNPFASTG